MQRLEVSGAVQHIYMSFGVKGLRQVTHLTRNLSTFVFGIHTLISSFTTNVLLTSELPSRFPNFITFLTKRLPQKEKLPLSDR
jgi:hypothetical protein